MRVRRHLISGLLVFTIIGSACGGSSTTPAGPAGPAGERVLGAELARATHDDVAQADVDAFVRGQTKFALDLYRLLAAKNADNLAISPESLTTALAMLLAGASDDARAEIANMLGVEDLGDRVPRVVNELMAELQSRAGKGVILEEANRIYLDPEFHVRAQFIELLATEFGAPLVNIDFKHDPEGARAAINAWVAEKTHGLIPELFPPDSITTDTVATLVNAVYLKAEWKTAFDKKRTSDLPFETPDGSKVQVPMMRANDIDAGFGDGWAAVELPYAGDKLAMVVIVPDDLAAFEQTLDVDRLDEVVGKLGTHTANLTLPRFETRSGGAIDEELQQLGMGSVYLGGGLHNISDDSRLAVSTVVHKVAVKVDEEGTEAAAATGIGIYPVCADCGPKLVVADQPFVYLVRDTTTGAILFLGRVTNPAAKGSSTALDWTACRLPSSRS